MSKKRPDRSPPPDPPRHREFPPTQWTLIARARSAGDEAKSAMEELCGRYWFPIYAYLRGRHHTKEEAEDLTQGFFQLLLRQDLFQSAQPERGRLRSLLLTALKHYLSNQQRNASAQKRGGGREILSFDLEAAESRFLDQTSKARDPETIYLQAWARTLIDKARQSLRQALQTAPHPEITLALEPYLDPGDDPIAYDVLAEKFSMREAALRLHVFRMRQKLGDLLREEVRQTVDSPIEVSAELDWIRDLLRR